MKIIYTLTLFPLITLTFFNIPFCISQSYTITSKSCGKCGKSVSSNSNIGGKCPYCGIIWGRKNISTSTSTQISPSHSSNIYSIDNTNQIPTNSKTSNIKKQTLKNEEDTYKSKASKSQTENWLLEKLNANTPKKSYDNMYYSVSGVDSLFPSYNQNYYYSFDNYSLIVEYEQKRGKITKYKIKIPIYDIDSVYEYEGDFWITTKKGTLVTYNLTDNTKRVGDSFRTNFDTTSETELCERLHKALIHLKKFYKKPISTEPF